MGKLVNRAKMTVSGTPGTGVITLGVAVPGFLAFASATPTAVANGDVVSYLVEDGAAWEFGQGTYASSGPTLTRTTIQGSSNAGAAINVTANATVAVVPLASDVMGGAADVIAEEQQASGTNAGSATSGSDQTRALNTLVRNLNALASLASNHITLPAGTYYAQWSAPALATGAHQTLIYNVTDSAVIGRGSSEYLSGSAATNRSEGSAVFTLAASKVLELRHRFTSSSPTNGLGYAAGFGTEVYARLEIWRIA